MSLTDLVIPGFMTFILVYGLYKKVPVFEEFVAGARSGIGVSLRILPSLVALVTAVGMFRASGALDVLTFALTPLARLLQIPSEVVPLALLHPISGSSAMVIFQDILKLFGPDSYPGLVASVMMGSTETTFYTIAIYFGAVGTRDTRYALPAALMGDLAGFFMSALAVRMLLCK